MKSERFVLAPYRNEMTFRPSLMTLAAIAELESFDTLKQFCASKYSWRKK